KTTLKKLPEIKTILTNMGHEKIGHLARNLTYPKQLITFLEESIVDDPPNSIKEGSLIKTGYHSQHDKYRDASQNGKEWIANLEQKEKEATGIRSLITWFHRVFCNYIEVTKPNPHLRPAGCHHHQQT